MERDLFPKISYTRRRKAAATNKINRSNGYTGQEIDILRRAVLHDGTRAGCPRCKAPLRSLTPISRSETGGVLWRARCAQCDVTVGVRAIPPGQAPTPGFRGLVVSNPRTKRFTAGPRTLFSVAGHAVIIYLAVLSSGRELANTDGIVRDTLMVVLNTMEQNTPEPEPPSQVMTVVAPVLPKGFQTLSVSIDFSSEIPEIDLTVQFDPRNFSGIGVEGGVFDGLVTGSDNAIANRPFAIAAVDEPPEHLSSPRLHYPEMLRTAGIQGYVIIGFVVDTTGHAESQSIYVMQSSNPAFDESAMDVIRDSRYRPGRMRGIKVRVLAQMRVEFNLYSARGKP